MHQSLQSIRVGLHKPGGGGIGGGTLSANDVWDLD